MKLHYALSSPLYQVCASSWDRPINNDAPCHFVVLIYYLYMHWCSPSADAIAGGATICAAVAGISNLKLGAPEIAGGAVKALVLSVSVDGLLGGQLG